MSIDQAVAIIAAATAFLGALAVVLQRIEALRKDVNGRMTQLLEEARRSAHKEGELRGRDFEHVHKPRPRRPSTDKPD